MSFFKKREARKNATELLRQSSHLRNIREDLLRESELKKLSECEECVGNALLAGEVHGINKACDALFECMGRIAPSPRPSAIAENFEILVVAVVVAMGFRTYFIQPFKIPTGSMEPTLNGIHAEAHAKPEFMDKVPMKFIKWLVYGEWYMEVKVVEDGVLSPRAETTPDEASMYWYVGDRRYKVPRGARPSVYSGTMLHKGDVLWCGTQITGDHVFVDKISWNFLRPRRGQVTVFSTKDIETLPPGTHYIKRLIALPGETVSILPPNVLIDGNIVTDTDGITRIERQEAGYKSGYTLPYTGGYGEKYFLATTNDTRKLGSGEYFVLGDNTTNSRDGRYWGTVPQKNTIGPAFLVYWPYSKRWGRIH